MTQKDHLLSIIGVILDQSPSIRHDSENSLPKDVTLSPQKATGWLGQPIATPTSGLREG